MDLTHYVNTCSATCHNKHMDLVEQRTLGIELGNANLGSLQWQSTCKTDLFSHNLAHNPPYCKICVKNNLPNTRKQSSIKSSISQAPRMCFALRAAMCFPWFLPCEQEKHKFQCFHRFHGYCILYSKRSISHQWWMPQWPECET